MGCVSSNSSDQSDFLHYRNSDHTLQANVSSDYSSNCIQDQNPHDVSTPTEPAIMVELVTKPVTQLHHLTIAPLERRSYQQRNPPHFIQQSVSEREVVESIDVAHPYTGKGFVLIINYSHNRQGSEMDVTKLNRSFQHELEYHVLIGENDMTRESLRRYFEEVRAMIDERFYCFICIVMAHGNEKGIITSDGKVQCYNEIIETFDNINMSAFGGRPKLFFINACRGDRRPWTVPVDYVGRLMMDAVPMPPIELVAETSDIYTIYSTVNGFVSNRDSQEGSVFIQTCVDVFQKYYTQRNICDMTTLIRYKVQQNHMCQISEAKTTLTKQFYFMKSRQ